MTDDLITTSKLIDCSRILISQNHTEMYIIIAEYEDSYRQYLRNKTPLNSSGFLYMNRFGPFTTTSCSDVDMLSCVLRTLFVHATGYLTGETRFPFHVPEPLAVRTGNSTAQGRTSTPQKAGSTSAAQSSSQAVQIGESKSPEEVLSVLRNPFPGLDWTSDQPDSPNLQFCMSPPSRSTQNLGLPELFSIMEFRARPKPEATVPGLASLARQSSAPAAATTTSPSSALSTSLARASTSEDTPSPASPDATRPTKPRDVPSSTRAGPSSSTLGSYDRAQLEGTGTQPSSRLLLWTKMGAEGSQDPAWTKMEFAGSRLSVPKHTVRQALPPKTSGSSPPSGSSPWGKPPLSPKSTASFLRSGSPAARAASPNTVRAGGSPRRVALLTRDDIKGTRKGGEESNGEKGKTRTVQ